MRYRSPHKGFEREFVMGSYPSAMMHRQPSNTPSIPIISGNPQISPLSLEAMRRLIRDERQVLVGVPFIALEHIGLIEAVKNIVDTG